MAEITEAPAVEIIPEAEAPMHREVSKYAQAEREARDAHMAEARKKGEAVWQAGRESFAKAKVPKIVYFSKKAEAYGISYPRMENIVPLLQSRKEQNQKSSLYVPVKMVMDHNKTAEKDDRFAVRPGCKTVTMLVNYDKDDQHAVSTRKCYNLDDLAGSPVDKIKEDVNAYFNDANKEKADARKNYAALANGRARDALSFLAMTEEKKTYGVNKAGDKALSFGVMNMEACESAIKAVAQRKEFAEKAWKEATANPVREAYENRLADMKAAVAVDSEAPDVVFKKALAKAYDTDKKTYVSEAAKSLQGKWSSEQIKMAITKFAPPAVYDATSKKGPLADRVMANLAQEKAQAAGR